MKHYADATTALLSNPPQFGCSCGEIHRADWRGWTKRNPERTQGEGSGYIRGEFIPNHSGGSFYDKSFWTHVTMSHGREVR